MIILAAVEALLVTGVAVVVLLILVRFASHRVAAWAAAAGVALAIAVGVTTQLTDQAFFEVHMWSSPVEEQFFPEPLIAMFVGPAFAVMGVVGHGIVLGRTLVAIARHKAVAELSG